MLSAVTAATVPPLATVASVAASSRALIARASSAMLLPQWLWLLNRNPAKSLPSVARQACATTAKQRGHRRRRGKHAHNRPR